MSNLLRSLPMQVLLDAPYHVGTQASYTAVPAPTKADPSIPWFWDWLAYMIPTFADAGITDIVLGPVGKAQGGSGQGCDGFGAFDPFRDFGQLPQQGSVEVRYGGFESLLRLIARAHRYGIRIHVSIVLHQRDGGKNKSYDFLGSDRKTLNGRWPLTQDCFTPPRPPDPIMGPQADNFAFGDPCSYNNALPTNYMFGVAADAVDSMTTLLDVDGFWIDDPKGLSQQAVSNVVNQKSMTTRWGFMEYFDGNPATENWVVWNEMNGRLSTMDFTLRWHVQAACNNASRYDMRQILKGGFNLWSPANAVTFAEDHDSDLSFPLIWNKEMGYAILMFMPGLPMPFGRDYFVKPECYGLAPVINKQIWCRQFLAQGEYIAHQNQSSYQIAIWERTGYGNAPGCLAIVNNEQGSSADPSSWRFVGGIPCHWPDGTVLKDYMGYSAWTPTVQGGTVGLWVGPNDNGTGYCCYAPMGINAAIQRQPQQTTIHRFEGAVDMPIGPVPAGATAWPIVRLWCDNAHPIKLTAVHGDAGIRYGIASAHSAAHFSDEFTPIQDGWYTVTASNQTETPQPFVMTVEYMGGSSMPESELTAGTFAINEVDGVVANAHAQRFATRARKLALTVPEDHPDYRKARELLTVEEKEEA